MGRGVAQRKPGLRPLWGFGWMGWAGLCVLGVVAVAAACCGIELRYELMRFVAEVSGGEAIYPFTSSVLYTAVWLSSATFSLVTLLLIVPAFFVSGRRMPWVSLGVLAALPLAGAVLAATGTYHPGTWSPSAIPSWLIPGVGAGGVHSERFVLGVAVQGAAACGALCLLTRSWLVAGCSGAAFLVALWSLVLKGWGVLTPLGWMAPQVAVDNVTWNLLVAGSVWVWAIRHRSSVVPAGACEGCGYDLAGLRGRVCPECGRAFVAVVRGLVAALRRRVRMAVA